ncbi:hypothetical protein BR93DRAFT_968858 [Coniochaeta sp. PMI_546]|nr:hypothetical protein BR93DRAFT_968858 [Coniochaeta sp. PMI_546]
MSGSGGFPKYRCKYFSTHGCDKWVLVMNAPCPYCVAAGRDALDLPAEQSFIRPREVCLPVVHQGTITYTIMDLVQTGQPGSYWALRRKTTQQPLMPTITTSDTPGIVLPTTGMGTHAIY